MKKILLSATVTLAIGMAGFSFIRARESSPSVLEPERQPAAAKKPDGKPAAKSPGRKGEPVRAPMASDPLEEIRSRSDGDWRFSRSRSGFVSKMSGGALGLGSRAPVVAASEFLGTYGRSLLGVNPGSMELSSSRPEEQTTQLLFGQTQGGLPVFGSRLNMIFDREGNLVYLVSDLYPGPFAAPGPSLDALAAAEIVRAALIHKLDQEGAVPAGGDYPASELSGYAVLGYRLDGSLVYRFHFPLHEPHYGDMEAVVDAADGGLVFLKNISRN